MRKMGAPQRFRSRYIAFKVEGEASIEELRKAISKSSREISRLNPRPRIVIYDGDEGCGLVKCSHLQVDELKRELKKIGGTGNESFKVRLLGVSGTIKATKRKFLSI
ncbi:hypothetical protein AKJ44_00820 [candidate division MSBL1 archaeon SCGC-AAA261F17]|uniref:Uncharacterized protein n=1 Tax=candidate division MSBL1 archaeon SCGC-AAA261F17 TaxID=1698274 RepID=A0A133V773_9EURY|nr:hypothetical protein AKJ44_00820 [candidate division MSBL1 archaeon SCGC-AAA261F17]